MTDTSSPSSTPQYPAAPDAAIEILSVELLNQRRPLINELKQFAHSLNLEFGWHYLLDLSWIISQLHPASLSGKRIMDAGAGIGVMQWYLAQHGADVLSVDRSSRADLHPRFRHRFNVQGLRPQDLGPAQYKGSWLRRIAASLRDNAAMPPSTLIASGRVLIYNQDLGNLVDIPDASLDYVVAVSALEHNTPEGLQKVVKEIMRTLKPGGMLLATLGAGRDEDWWHEPSSGWCYTDVTLRQLFDLPDSTPSNYAQFDELLHALHDCAELRAGLASFYFNSANNGMPWGVWDPKYPPVGVRKVKN